MSKFDITINKNTCSVNEAFGVSEEREQEIVKKVSELWDEPNSDGGHFHPHGILYLMLQNNFIKDTEELAFASFLIGVLACKEATADDVDDEDEDEDEDDKDDYVGDIKFEESVNDTHKLSKGELSYKGKDVDIDDVVSDIKKLLIEAKSRSANTVEMKIQIGKK
jgi:hypothetical protein